MAVLNSGTTNEAVWKQGSYNVDFYDRKRLDDFLSTGDTVSVDNSESGQITMEVGAMQTAEQVSKTEFRRRRQTLSAHLWRLRVRGAVTDCDTTTLCDG